MLASASASLSKRARGNRQEATWAFPSAKPSKFYDLLKQLCEEHDREIRELTEDKRKKDDGFQPSPPPEPLHFQPPRPPEEMPNFVEEETLTKLDPSQGSSSRGNSLIIEETVGRQACLASQHESQSLRAIWLDAPDVDNLQESTILCQQRNATQSIVSGTGIVHEARTPEEGKPWFISYPNAKGRLLWDISGMLFIAVDFFMIPFSVFDPPRTVGWDVCAWIILLFWTADIGATFLVGYVEKGQIIVEPSKVSSRYLRSWFVVDLIVVIPDWLATLVLSRDDSKPGGATRLIRTLRIARILRLLRLMKLGRILATIEDRIDSEYVFVVVEVFKLIVVVLMTSHMLACAFYAIGTFHDGPDTWHSALEGTSLDYKYFTSLHWSLAKVALESMDLEAMNTRERVFTVAILTLGLFVFGSVVSRITMSMLQLQELGKEQSKQLWFLRRYLVERSVPTTLGTRIQRFIEHEVERQQYYIPEESVRLLGLLSKHLSGELHSCIAMTIMGSHMFIQKLSEVSHVVVFRICEKAITRSQCARGDTLFSQGEECFTMFFVVTGVVRYSLFRSGADPYSNTGDGIRLGNKSYLCEPALWCKWIYRGFAGLETQSELLELHATALGDVVQHHPLIHVQAQQYATEFAQALKQVPMFDSSDMIDCKFLGLNVNLAGVPDDQGYRKSSSSSQPIASKFQRAKTQFMTKNFSMRSYRDKNSNKVESVSFSQEEAK